MSLHEIEHPLAQELVVIMQAAESGLASSPFIPSRTRITYVSPLEAENGAAMLQITDKNTANFTAIQVPVFSDASSGLIHMDKEGVSLTGARILVSDIYGNEFGIGVGEEDVPVSYLQFDIAPDGIVFSAEPNGHKVAVYGVFESELYMSWAQMARTQASIDSLYQAAVWHLDSVA